MVFDRCLKGKWNWAGYEVGAGFRRVRGASEVWGFWSMSGLGYDWYNRIIVERMTRMKRRIFKFALIMLLGSIVSGCSLFTSEDLDNHTAKDAVTGFLEATFTKDVDRVEKLATFDEGKQEDFIAKAAEQGLGDVAMKACVFDEGDDDGYEVVCENDDDKDVFMTVSLSEDDGDFFVEDAVMNEAVDFRFTQDAPELTDEYVREIEEMIGDDLHELDADEKEDLKFQTYHIVDGILALFEGDAEELSEFVDLDVFARGDRPANVDELHDAMKDSLPGIQEDVVPTEILFGSHYDHIEGLGVENKDDYHEIRNVYPYPIETSPMIEVLFENKNGESTYFSGDFYVEDGNLLIGEYTFRDQSHSVLHSTNYDIKPEDEDMSKEEKVYNDDMEEIYELNCASCHASDMSGSVGPDISNVGDDFTEEELVEIMVNGEGDMPPTLLDEEEAEALSEWLLEQE